MRGDEMGGGSFNYLFRRVEEMAGDLDEDRPLFAAFADRLRLVAKAMHDVEWVYSGDYCEDGADESIRAVLPAGAEVEAAAASLATAERQFQDATARSGIPGAGAQYWVVRYRFRLPGRRANGTYRSADWAYSTQCVSQHPVDWIRETQRDHGRYVGKEERVGAHGLPEWEDYELLFFAEIPEAVFHRANDAEWGH